MPYSFNSITLIETFLSYMNFGEQIWCVLLGMSFEAVTHIWSHVSENKKKIAKIQNLKFHNCLNNFGRDPS